MEFLDLGYADERFKEVVNEDLHCPICTNVLKQPVHCVSNEHYFCKACITRHLENDEKCPCCMERLSFEDLKPPSRFVTNRLSQLTIHCDNSDRGCQELVGLGDLSSHVKSCGFSSVVCSNEGCALTMNKKEQHHHETATCHFLKIKCAECGELKKEVEEMKKSLKEVKAQLSDMESVKEFFCPMTIELMDKMKNVEEAFGRLKQESNVREDIIILGGTSGESKSLLNSVEKFSWSTMSWEELKPMERSLGKSSVVVYNDQVIASGGLTSADSRGLVPFVTNNIEIISLSSLTKASGKWSKFPATMPVKRSAHKCVIYQDRLVVIGGFDNKKGKSSDGIDEVLLTPPHSSKSLVFRMPCPRQYHGAEIFGDKIVIVGGTSSGNMSAILHSVLEYDVNTKKHRILPPLPFPVTGMATVAWRGKVVVIGGVETKSNWPDTVDKVVMYDPKTGKSTMLPSMKHKREGCSAIVTGNVIVVMGGHNATEKCLNAVEYFSFDSFSWQELPAMNKRRSYASTIRSIS